MSALNRGTPPSRRRRHTPPSSRRRKLDQ